LYHKHKLHVYNCECRTPNLILNPCKKQLKSCRKCSERDENEPERMIIDNSHGWNSLSVEDILDHLQYENNRQSYPFILAIITTILSGILIHEYSTISALLLVLFFIITVV